MDFKGPNGRGENIRWGEGLFQKCLVTDFQTHSRVKRSVCQCEQQVLWLVCVFVYRSVSRRRMPVVYQSPLTQSPSHVLWQIGRQSRGLKLGREKRRQMDKTESWHEPWPALCRLHLTYFTFLPFSPRLVPALCPPASVIPFHVAQGTNKSKEGLPPDTSADSYLSISRCPSELDESPPFSPNLDRQPWLTNHEDCLSSPLQQSNNQLFFF